jgi:hypothetical protein
MGDASNKTVGLAYADGFADFTDLSGVTSGVKGKDSQTFHRRDLASDGMVHFDGAEIVLASGNEFDGAGAVLAELFGGFDEGGVAPDRPDLFGGRVLARAIGAVPNEFLLAIFHAGICARRAALRDHDEHAALGGDHVFGAFEDRPAIGSRFSMRLFLGDAREGREEIVARAGEEGEILGAILVVHAGKIA